VQRVDYISDALGFRVAATNLPVHQQPIPINDQTQPSPSLEPVVVETEDPIPTATGGYVAQVVSVTAAPEAAVPAEAIPVPVEYDIGLRTGIDDIEVVAAVEAVPAEVIVLDAKEEAAPVVQEVVPQVAVPYTQQVVQVAPQAADQYAAQYLLPGYTANYAPAYQPYAANYGYYYNPSYVATSGALTHSQYHAQDEIGQYNYGYATADSSKSEIKTADGIVQGTYSYIDANGIVQTTNYVSDALGFRVAATNLPVAVEAPAAPAA
jgi:Insect cuticle protein